MARVFEDATSVTSFGAGRYQATVHDGWDIGGNANGGYLLAIAGRAMADEVGRPPLSLTAHYLRPAPSGECEVVVDVVRIGRRLATATATLILEGTPVLELLGTFGDQQPRGEIVAAEPPVDLPSYADCAPQGQSTDAVGAALMDRLAVRLRPGDEGFRHGMRTGRAEVAGWFALAREEPIDSIALLLAADAFPPAVFNADVPVAWAPTVELTVHVRGEPSPGPLACLFTSRFIHGGLLDEQGEMWDSSGALVAQSRQIALLPRG